MNPELRRLLWINISWQRLLFIPALALMISYILWKTTESVPAGGVPFYLFILWGCYGIFSTLADEVRSRTWYWQLILPLSAWELVWTKLVGVLIMPWVGGLLILISLYHSEKEIWLYIANGLLLNTVTLFFSLLVREKDKKRLGLPEIAIYTVIFFALIKSISSEFSFTIDLIVTLFFLGWMFIGAWRIMAREKQHTPLPSLWLLFIVYMVGYVYFCATYDTHKIDFLPQFFEGYIPFGENTTVSDLYDNDNTFLTFNGIAFLTLLTIAYLSVFLYANRLSHINLFADACRRRDKLAIWRTMPPWLMVWFPLIVSLLGLFLLSADTTVLVWGVPILLFAVRDTAILLLFTLNNNSRLPEGIACLILAVLYALLPWLMNASGSDAPYELFYVSDDDDANIYITATSALVQAIVACGLLWRHRLRSVIAV